MLALTAGRFEVRVEVQPGERAACGGIGVGTVCTVFTDWAFAVGDEYVVTCQAFGVTGLEAKLTCKHRQDELR